MSTLWVALLVAAVGCYGLKLLGMSVPAAVLDHPRVQRVAALLPVGMLSALIVVELFDGGAGAYRWDWATVAGVAAGGALVLLRQGVLVVFVVAISVTALLRLAF